METAFEQLLMSSYKQEMVAHMADHPEDYKEAIQLALGDEQPYAWRATFVLSGCMMENDDHIKPFLDDFIKVLPKKKDGHQRDILNILDKMNLNEEQEGYVLDRCIQLWESTSKQPSVRFVAIRIIVKMVKRYPELATEIKYLTEPHYLESLSPGAKRSIQKMTRKFQ